MKKTLTFFALILISAMIFGQATKIPMNVHTKLYVAFPIINKAIDTLNKQGDTINAIRSRIRYVDATSSIQTQLNNIKAGVFNVKDYGAIGDGSHDDTQAIKDAIAATQDIWGDRGYSSIIFPKGEFVVTSTITINQSRISLKGLGKYISTITFNPTSDTILFKFIGSPATYGYLAQNEIKDLAIKSGNTHIKIAIWAKYFEEFNVENIGIYPLTNTDITSIGLYLSYGQQGSFKLIDIWCDRPIVLANIDHSHFSDCYLMNFNNYSPHPIVEVLDGYGVSNLIFDGYQAWVGGTYGFYWNDTHLVGVTGGLYFNNIRWEQGLSDAWGFHIVGKSDYCFRDISFTNVFTSSRNGFYLRKITNVGFKNVSTWGTINDRAININSTVAAVNFDNCAFDQPVILTGAIAISGSYRSTLLNPYYPSIDSYFIPHATNLLINPSLKSTNPFSQIESPADTVLADGVFTIGSPNMVGILYVVETTLRTVGVFSLTGLYGTVTLITNSGSNFSITKDNSATYNVYYDEISAPIYRYKIQNKNSSTAIFKIIFIGASDVDAL